MDAERRAEIDAALARETELPALMRALGGRFIAPVPGGDLIRSPEILPTGRNIHAFDPFRMPTAFAMADGARQAQLLLETHKDDAAHAWRWCSGGRTTSSRTAGRSRRRWR